MARMRKALSELSYADAQKCRADLEKNIKDLRAAHNAIQAQIAAVAAEHEAWAARTASLTALMIMDSLLAAGKPAPANATKAQALDALKGDPGRWWRRGSTRRPAPPKRAGRSRRGRRQLGRRVSTVRVESCLGYRRWRLASCLRVV